jgi:hypothetical protein
MTTPPLASFFGSALLVVDGWQVYRGRACLYASIDGVQGIPLADRRVPDAVRVSVSDHFTAEQQGVSK